MAAVYTHVLRITGIPNSFGETELAAWFTDVFGEVLYVEIFLREDVLDNGEVIKVHAGKGAVVFRHLEDQYRCLESSFMNHFYMSPGKKASADIMWKSFRASWIKDEAGWYLWALTHPNPEIGQNGIDAIRQKRIRNDEGLVVNQLAFDLSNARTKQRELLARTVAVPPFNHRVTPTTSAGHSGTLARAMGISTNSAAANESLIDTTRVGDLPGTSVASASAPPPSMPYVYWMDPKAYGTSATTSGVASHCSGGVTRENPSLAGEVTGNQPPNEALSSPPALMFLNITNIPLSYGSFDLKRLANDDLGISVEFVRVRWNLVLTLPNTSSGPESLFETIGSGVIATSLSEEAVAQCLQKKEGVIRDLNLQIAKLDDHDPMYVQAYAEYVKENEQLAQLDMFERSDFEFARARYLVDQKMRLQKAGIVLAGIREFYRLKIVQNVQLDDQGQFIEHYLAKMSTLKA